MKIFIDLGAYTGDTIKLAKQKFKDLDKFIGFEPVPRFFEIAQKRFANDKRVELYQLAASTKHKENEKFYISRLKGSSLLSSKNNIKLNEYILITTIDFSEFIKEKCSLNDDIILKVDIEGEEYNLFEHLIDNDTIKYFKKIYCDWHYTKTDVPKQRHKDVVNKLVALGFDMTGNNEYDAF